MESNEDTTSRVDVVPRKSQSLKSHGKSPRPSLKNRVIVYDCDQKTIEVRSEDDVVKSKDSTLI